MKREIKFRAFDAEQKRMIETFDGPYKLLVHEEYGTLYCGGNMSNGDWVELPLMQFTGLLDKNGKEIYEGDWLHLAVGYTSKVEFQDGMFVSLYSHPEDGETLPLIDIISCKTIIFGNIHEQQTQTIKPQ